MLTVAEILIRFEVVGLEDRYKFLVHDRDRIFANQLDESIRALGIRVLKSAPRGPKMNSICDASLAQSAGNAWTG